MLREEAMRFAAGAVVVLVVMTICLSGCATKQREGPVAPVAATADSDRWRATDEAVVNSLMQNVQGRAQSAGGVTHVVLLWLKQPGDEAAIKRITETSREFRQIPGVLAVRVGRPLPSTRPVVDSSFDVGLAMSFADETALQAYETHPQHVKAVREVLRPLAARIQVYDIREADASSAPASEKRTERSSSTTKPVTKR